ncbi:hypothetical protein Tco_0003898 [Tanacetum coccineum]
MELYEQSSSNPLKTPSKIYSNGLRERKKLLQERDSKRLLKERKATISEDSHQRSLRVHTLELEDGTMIHMLAERRYPLSRELMLRMLDHGMEVEDESRG